jgi:hypothetical protein
MSSGEEGKARLLEELDILLPHQGIIIIIIFFFFIYTSDSPRVLILVILVDKEKLDVATSFILKPSNVV